MTKILDKWIQNPSGITPVDEQPTGVVNGVNTDFVLSFAPQSTTHIVVFLNGIKEDNYTINLGTKTITFTTAPELGQVVRAYYFK